MIRIIQIILGLLFLLSGLAKGFDPQITVLKLDQYLAILGLDALKTIDLPLLILINTTEITLGLALILNIYPKASLWFATIMMAVFTPKTLYVAINNLMTSSGCFGTWFDLTPWQSHWKNVFMDLLLVVLWIKYKYLRSSEKIQRPALTVLIIILLAFIYQAVTSNIF